MATLRILGICTLALSACGPDGSDKGTPAGEDAEQTIRFQGAVGRDAFRCAAFYEGVGKSSVQASFGDLKLYVHDLVALLPDGTEQAVELAEEAPWQGEGVALIDLEDATGSCGPYGDAEVRDVVVGTFRDDAVGIRLTLGVPDALNLGPITADTPAPLQRDDLLVNETAGYTSFRTMVIAGGTGRWPVEIYDAWGVDPASGEAHELQDSRTTYTLSPFDVRTDAIVVDLGALLADSDPTKNWATTPPNSSTPIESPPGCQMTAGDQDCGPIFTHYGIGESEGDLLRVDTAASPSP